MNRKDANAVKNIFSHNVYRELNKRDDALEALADAYDKVKILTAEEMKENEENGMNRGIYTTCTATDFMSSILCLQIRSIRKPQINRHLWILYRKMNDFSETEHTIPVSVIYRAVMQSGRCVCKMNKKKTLFNLKGKFDYKILLWDLLYDIAGSILYAAGIYTFAGNAGFAPGGVSGLALILNHLLGLPVGMVTLLFNIPLVVISYKAVGKALLIKSAKTMVISSLFLDVIFPFIPMYTGSRLMAAICSGVFMGAGMALFYIRGSSSGGIDFLALTIKKKKPHMTIGVITLLIDLVVILLGWPVFGDVDAVLYGVASTVVSTIVIDKILYGTGAGTLAIIITEKGSQIGVKIGENVRRGVTMIPAEGGYTGMRRDVILCACSKAEAYLVKSAVQEADEKAFVMFTETSEVFGEGFKTEIK